MSYESTEDRLDGLDERVKNLEANVNSLTNIAATTKSSLDDLSSLLPCAVYELLDMRLGLTSALIANSSLSDTTKASCKESLKQASIKLQKAKSSAKHDLPTIIELMKIIPPLPPGILPT